MWKNCLRLESLVSLISWHAINLRSEVVSGSLEWVLKRNGMVVPWPRSGMVIHLNWWRINSLQRCSFIGPNVNMSVFVWEDQCIPPSLQWSIHYLRPSTLFHIFWMFRVYDYATVNLVLFAMFGFVIIAIFFVFSCNGLTRLSVSISCCIRGFRILLEAAS